MVGLSQLQSLNLSGVPGYPMKLRGQFLKFVRAQPARDFIRSPFPIGTLDPISGLVELKQLNLFNCLNLTGTFGCGVQLRSSLIGGAGDLQALQNLNQLTNLNLK